MEVCYPFVQAREVPASETARAHHAARRRGCVAARGAKQGDELAAPNHSITSSARASSVGGISRPSALAVARLMTNSNLVGCITGRSDGLAPLRMRPV